MCCISGNGVFYCVGGCNADSVLSWIFLYGAFGIV
ncbi:MAG: hypothetical protein K1W27_05205 [Lachnospiraceae bacterium]